MTDESIKAPYEKRPLYGLTRLNTIDATYTILLYGVFVAYALGHLPFLALFLGVHLYVIRAFNLRHEKVHLPSNQFKGFNYWFTDLITLPYLPYQEPFLEKRAKHLAHHKTHLPKQRRSFSLAEDPHLLLEQDNIAKALFCCFFYEEIMFYFDYKKHKGLSKERKFAMAYSLTLAAIIIAVFGIWAHLALMAAYRLNMTFSWFFFSYILHRPIVYSGKLAAMLPRFVGKGIEAFVGSSGGTTIAYHSIHHADQVHFLDFSKPIADS